jgi:hypothetical protein
MRNRKQHRQSALTALTANLVLDVDRQYGENPLY